MKTNISNQLIAPLVNRTNLQIPLDDLLDQVMQAYDIGNFINITPIFIGYEDFNSKLTTSTGNYLLKVFNKEKNKRLLDNYVYAINHFFNKKIPVPFIEISREEGELYVIKNQEKESYMCLMAFFEGKKFSEITSPKISDMQKIVKIIAEINSTPITITNNYDSWGTVNLLKEYANRKHVLIKEEAEKIEKIVEKFKRIDFNSFPKSVIHGDVQKEHVLKNDKGDFCLIDFGCMDYNISVFDLSIYLALFCIDPSITLEENIKIIDKITHTYNSKRNLLQIEKDSISDLVSATYAIYFIRSTYEHRINKDDSEQTKNWMQFGWKGINLMESIH